MAFEQKETSQKYCEASIRCLQNKSFPYKLQCGGNLEERFPDQKDGVGGKSGGGAVEPDGQFSNASFGPPMCQRDFYVWSASHPDIQRAQQGHFHAFESHFYPTNHDYGLPMDNHFHYMPFRTSPHAYRPDVLFQEFQYFVVIDFEATCDKDKKPHPQEIIEFPSVLVNSMTGQLEDFFQIYVRPTHNQYLSDFCKELTGIQQNQVDKGVLLSEALLRHDKWLEGKGIKHTNFAVVTWSNWDCRVMLESECRYKRIRKPPYFNRWINLKVPFHKVFGGIRCNLKEAVQLAGLAWEGRPHCGLDDAKNTARLLAHMMHRGFRFSITNSMLWQSAEHHPLTMHQLMGCQSSSHHLQPFRVKHPLVPFIQYHPHPVQADPKKEKLVNCFCGAKGIRRMVRKPGPKQGSFFYGCGNWTAARGAHCSFFEWVAP